MTSSMVLITKKLLLGTGKTWNFFYAFTVWQKKMGQLHKNEWVCVLELSRHKLLLCNSTDQCMHFATSPCSHAPRHLVAIPAHAAMPPSSLYQLHEAVESDHAAGGVTTVHWPAPATVTVEPSENSAATEGRHSTAFELDSSYQWNEDCWVTSTNTITVKSLRGVRLAKMTSVRFSVRFWFYQINRGFGFFGSVFCTVCCLMCIHSTEWFPAQCFITVLSFLYTSTVWR